MIHSSLADTGWLADVCLELGHRLVEDFRQAQRRLRKPTLVGRDGHGKADMAGGVGAVSPNGVLGDPAGASAAIGERVLSEMTADAVRRIRDGIPDARGMLSRSSIGARG